MTKISTKLKNLYMFDSPHPQIQDHMNCVPTDNYRILIENWKNSISQREAMKTSICTKWEFVKHRPQKITDPFWHETII